MSDSKDTTSLCNKFAYTYTGTLMTGAEFNKLNIYELYKFIPKTKICRNFTYKIGLNIDTNIFNPTGKCEKGGLYFTDINNIYLFHSYGEYICKITIPDDAKVYIELNKYKADKFVVENMIDYSQFYLDKINNKYANKFIENKINFFRVTKSYAYKRGYKLQNNYYKKKEKFINFLKKYYEEKENNEKEEIFNTFLKEYHEECENKKILEHKKFMDMFTNSDSD